MHQCAAVSELGDAFAIDVRNATLDAPEAARRAFAGQPGWIAKLLAIRNILVAPLGLKPGADGNLPASGRVGIFSSSERVVLGFDDRHLDFRNSLFGRVYLATVTPFHKLIVPTMLARVSDEADKDIVHSRPG